MLLIALIIGCAPTHRDTARCPQESHVEAFPWKAPYARYFSTPEGADLVAYQCTPNLRDCVDAPSAIDDRGQWYAWCEPDAERSQLLVEWVVP